jgi:hypothetical protein
MLFTWLDTCTFTSISDEGFSTLVHLQILHGYLAVLLNLDRPDGSTRDPVTGLVWVRQKIVQCNNLAKPGRSGGSTYDPGEP